MTTCVCIHYPVGTRSEESIFLSHEFARVLLTSSDRRYLDGKERTDATMHHSLQFYFVVYSNLFRAFGQRERETQGVGSGDLDAARRP